MPPKGYSAKKQIAMLTKENIELKEALAALQVTLEKERGNRADIEREYRDHIETLSKTASTYRQSYFESARQYDQVCEQNIALRKALKEVL